MSPGTLPLLFGLNPSIPVDQGCRQHAQGILLTWGRQMLVGCPAPFVAQLMTPFLSPDDTWRPVLGRVLDRSQKTCVSTLQTVVWQWSTLLLEMGVL